jgi:hypothetical protein
VEGSDVLLSPEEAEYFRTMESLFLHDGWPLLVKQLNDAADSMADETFDSAKRWEDVVAARAVRAERRILAQYDEYLAQRKEALILQRLQQLQGSEEQPGE